MHDPLHRPIPYNLNYTQLEFEELSLDKAPDLHLESIIFELPFSGTEIHRIFDAALALYERKCSDTAFEGISRPDIFAVCIDTAMIWEFG